MEGGDERGGGSGERARGASALVRRLQPSCKLVLLMATGGTKFTTQQLARALKRLGKERLVNEATARLPKPENGNVPANKLWAKLPIDELALELVDALGPDDTIGLAAEGLRLQRTPPVGGPSWKYEGDSAIDAEAASKAVKGLATQCPAAWTDISASLEAAQMFAGVGRLEYTSWTVQATSDQLIEVPSRNIALLLFDYEDQVVTVSAGGDQDALVIGAAVERALKGKLLPIELKIPASVKSKELSGRTLEMLEAVYGRMSAVVEVVNVDKIKTKRQDPDSPVKEQTAKGEDDHVLVDSDVRTYLRRGDDLVAISCQIRWTYGDGKQDKTFVSRATLASSEHGPFTLRVTRGGRDVKLAAELYIELRRVLLKPTSAAGKKKVGTVVKQELRAK